MNIKNALIPMLLMIVIFSCQPKDVTVTRPGNSGNVNTNSANLSSLEFDKLLSLSLDRQFEAIHLLKAVLNPTYAESKNLKVSKDKSETITIKLLNVPKYDKKTVRDESFYFVDFEVQALHLDENGKLISLVLKNAPTKTPNSISFNAAGADFSSKALNEFISIRVGTTSNEYIINFDRLDDTSSKADRQSNLIVTGVATLTWDGMVESLDQPLRISLNKFYVDRKGNKTGFMRFSSVVSKDLIVELNNCIIVNGNITLTQRINAKTGAFDKISSVNYTDSSLVMTDGTRSTFSYSAKECAHRPIIDFTKLL